MTAPTKMHLNTGPNAFGTVAVPFRGPVHLRSRSLALSESDLGLLDPECSGSVQCQSTGAASLRALIEELHDSQAFEQLSAVNRAVNRLFSYAAENFGFPTRDDWKSFRRTLQSGEGDCEDFAIAKAAVLRRLGFSEKDLYLTVLKEKWTGRYHAVLLVRQDGRYHVLDNRFESLRTEDDLSSFTPLYSINGEKIWLHGEFEKQVAEAGDSF